MRAILPNRQTGVAIHVFSRSEELREAGSPLESTRGSPSPLESGQDLVKVGRRLRRCAEWRNRGAPAVTSREPVHDRRDRRMPSGTDLALRTPGENVPSGGRCAESRRCGPREIGRSMPASSGLDCSQARITPAVPGACRRGAPRTRTDYQLRTRSWVSISRAIALR